MRDLSPLPEPLRTIRSVLMMCMLFVLAIVWTRMPLLMAGPATGDPMRACIEEDVGCLPDLDDQMGVLETDEICDGSLADGDGTEADSCVTEAMAGIES